jgi:hypothetical protein
MASAKDHWAALRTVGAAVIIAAGSVLFVLAVLNYPFLA